MVGEAEQELAQVVAAADDAVERRSSPARSPRAARSAVSKSRSSSTTPSAARSAVPDERRAAERDGLVEDRERVAHGAVAAAGDEHERVVVGRDALLGADHLELLDDLRDGDAAEVEALRAREDRREHLVRLGRREDEQGVLGRLLERLQDRVEGARREHVHLVEDVDLLLGALRRDADRLAQLAHVVDAVVARGVDLDDVDRAAVVERRARLARAARLGVGPLGERRLAVDGLGEDARRRRLADAARAREEVRVREAPERTALRSVSATCSCATSAPNVCGRYLRAETR